MPRTAFLSCEEARENFVVQAQLYRVLQDVPTWRLPTGAKAWAIKPLSRASFEATCRNPEHPGGRHGVNCPLLPPGHLVPRAVVVAVMCPAQRYRELVADLAPHRPRLSEPQMVRVGGTSPANQTGLRRDEFEMGFIAKPTRFADRKFAFLNFGRRCISREMRRGRRVVVEG